MPDAITDFRGDHFFLSNFYPAVLTFENADYPTVEHAFQAAKTFDYAVRRKFQQTPSPSTAKQMGRRLKRREDWFDVSLTIMEDLLRQKFTRYPELGASLRATGDADLIEGNNWGDRFYGCEYDTKKQEWVGENHLGRLLMKIRSELVAP